MINEIKLRELFEEKLKSVDPRIHFLTVIYRWNFFEWFKFGFEAAYPPMSILKVADPLTPEKRQALLKQLKDTGFHSGRIVAEPDSKLIFVYSWRSAQQRTMIILADSREEADTIFDDQFEEADLPTFYVTQLFVDGGDSTIIYNN
jgi:hypothetical protein